MCFLTGLVHVGTLAVQVLSCKLGKIGQHVRIWVCKPYFWVWLRQAAYEAVFDPLDGSRNIDAGIPTGTIFGVYKASGRSLLMLQL